MTISIWRYSHFLLALVSSIFLLIASVTGVILAVEPIQHQAKGHAIKDLDQISLATTIHALDQNYEEVFSFEVESSHFVKASVLTMDLETHDIYIDPRTGEQLGMVQDRPGIYSFATNLHRSLFLKGIGRFFVGSISFLLLLITLTGLVLLAKRQGGIKKLFSKVQQDYMELRYHVILSRWFFIPIIILSVTGVYLSLEKFNLLPDTSTKHWVEQKIRSQNKYNSVLNIPFFQNTTLQDVRMVEFPFSEDPEEFYQISLKYEEIQVNQETGDIVASASYPFVTLASRVSFNLHTGEGSVVWSLVLLLASASILFFIYSGAVMSVKRIKRGKKHITLDQMPDKDESEIIILVGSETGTTYDFALQLYRSMSSTNKKIYLTELNHYTTFQNAEHIIILTSTYGEGDSPTNARKFLGRIKSVHQPKDLNYSVVGFGSTEYPDYCKYAIEVDIALNHRENFTPLLPLQKINNAAFSTFNDWAQEWSKASKIEFSLRPASKKQKKIKLVSFDVVHRSDLNIDDTFLLRLRPKNSVDCTSGDLLSIYPKGSDIARQYSVAKIGKDIVLSIKKHDFGLCSTFLSQLEQGSTLMASIDKNPHFHFPKKTPSAILIANGTGIAPFLGMIHQHNTIKISLLWGVRYTSSTDLYCEYIENNIGHNTNIAQYIAYSREENKMYVQDMLSRQEDHILKTIKDGGCIMICGSLAMQRQVLDVLESILLEHTELDLDLLQSNGQLRMDCY